MDLMVCTTITQGYSRATDVDSSDSYGCWWQQVIPIAYYIGIHPVILKAMMDRTPTLGSQSGFAKVKPTAESVMHWLRGEDAHLDVFAVL